jgi:hypothetical protein
MIKAQCLPVVKSRPYNHLSHSHVLQRVKHGIINDVVIELEVDIGNEPHRWTTSGLLPLVLNSGGMQ